MGVFKGLAIGVPIAMLLWMGIIVAAEHLLRDLTSGTSAKQSVVAVHQDSRSRPHS